MVPDPYKFNADSEPAFHLNADPDPAPHQSDINLRPLVYIQYTPGLHFEPLKLLNFFKNADPDLDSASL
jgi:hypothetical protein